MTNEQITSRCRHCGCTKKEHNVRKPYRCPTHRSTSYWEPWDLASYQEAQETGQVAAAARVLTPQEEADRAAAIAAAPLLLGRTIDLTPQEPAAPQEAARTVSLEPRWERLFQQFARDAKSAGGQLSVSLCAAQFDRYPEDAQGLERRAKVLRAVQGYLAPFTIALQAATTAQAIEELRDVAADTLANLDRWASEFEYQAEGTVDQES